VLGADAKEDETKANPDLRRHKKRRSLTNHTYVNWQPKTSREPAVTKEKLSSKLDSVKQYFGKPEEER